MEIKHLLHKHGGRITSIRSISHATEKGQSFWFYVGDVAWSDGGTSEDLEIAPWAVCYDHGSKEADAEYGKLSDMLMDYLRRNGRWMERKKGYPQAWVPTVRHSYERIAA